MTEHSATNWLVYDHREGKFQNEYGHPTNYVDEAHRWSYDEAHAIVVNAAVGDWQDGKPPKVMIPDQGSGGTYEDLCAQAKAAGVLIAAATERMIADRETVDWSHPVPIGGLPEDSDSEPPIPANEHELAAWLTAHNGSKHSPEVNAMYDRMEAEHGRERNTKLWDNAGADMDHDSACDEAIATLADATSRAIAALFEAQAALHRLAKGDAWHVEYAECTRGEDIGAFLMQARRAAMAAGMLHRETAGA